MENVVCLGMACRVPNADNVEEFWTELVNGKDAIGETSPRWPCGLYGLPSRTGLLKDITRFDNDFFHVPQEKVETMDPQLRIVLEVSTEAVMDSAISPKILSELKTGVYTTMLNSESEHIGFHIEDSSTGVVAKHLAKHLNLNGPSICVDCACSSALQAVLLAKTDIVFNRADFALVIGCSLLLSPNQSLQNLMLGMLSSDGKCRAWDANAKGYVRSEGIFAVLLGRYPSSVFYPRIYGHIIAGASNSDGFKSEGILFPSRKMQQELLEKIYKSDMIKIEDIVYVECHATGTPAGDPEELAALCSLLRSPVNHTLLVGSCKSNIGHTEWAAGLASLIKVLLCIQNGKIPGNLHFSKPNPAIYGFSNGLLVPVISLTSLPYGNIGISGMGFGGSNCHLVIEPPKDPISTKIQPKVLLVLLGSRTKTGLMRVRDFLFKNSCLETILLINQMFSYHASQLSYQEILLLQKVNGFYNKELSKYVIDNIVKRRRKRVWLIIHDIAIIEDSTNDFDACQIALINQFVSHWLQEPGISNYSSESSLLYSLIEATLIILGVVEALKMSGLEIGGIIGSGLSEIVALMIQEGSSTVTEGLKMIEAFYKITLSNDPEIKNYECLQVETSLELLNAICKDFFTICQFSENCFLISGCMEAMKSNKLQLNANEIHYQEKLLFNCLLYTPLLKDKNKELKTELKYKLTSGKLRWNNWISTLTPKHDKRTFFETEKADHNYFSQIAYTPVYLSDALQAVPVNSFKIHIGRVAKPLWVSDRDIYIDVSSGVEILAAFASMYKEGFDLDLSKLQPLTEPVSVSTPSVGQLMQWNHEFSWPTPHWKQFSFTVKDEESSKCFSFDTSELSLSLLLEVALDKIMEIQKQIPSAVEFYNLSPISRGWNENEAFRIQLLTGLRRFEIRQGTTIIFKGNYDLKEKVELPEIHFESSSSGNLEHWEVPWQGSWSVYLNHIQVHLSVLYKELNMIPFSVTFYLGCNQHGKTNTLVTFEKVTGICRCGNILKMILPSIEIMQSEHNVALPLRTPMESDSQKAAFTFRVEDAAGKSNPPPNHDIGVSPKENICVMIHALRLYQLSTVTGKGFSIILTYCGRIQGGKHVLGLNHILAGGVKEIIKPLPIPTNIPCCQAVSLLVPFLLSWHFRNYIELNCEITDKTTVLVLADSESLVPCIVHTFQQMPCRIVMSVKGNLVTPNTIIDRDVKRQHVSQMVTLHNSESSLFISPSLLSPENLQMRFVKEVIVSTPEHNYNLNFTPSPINEKPRESGFSSPVEQQNNGTKNANDEMTTDSESQSKDFRCLMSKTHNIHEPSVSPASQSWIRSSPGSIEHKIQKDIMNRCQWLPIQSFSKTQIKMITDSKGVDAIISFHTGFLQWLDVLNFNGQILHLGEVALDMSSVVPPTNSSWCIVCQDPLEIITDIGSKLKDAQKIHPSINKMAPTPSKLWSLLASIGISAGMDAEHHSLYRCSECLVLLASISLSTVHKNILKAFKYLTSEDVSFFQGLHWLRDLCTTPIAERGFNLQMPVFSESQGEISLLNRSTFRPWTPVPCVFSLTPELEQQEKVMKHLSVPNFTPNFISPDHNTRGKILDNFILDFVSPLSRPSLPTLVSMNTVVSGDPVFLIHPITGVLNLLRNLGRNLPFPCFGIQQTEMTPKNSLDDLAKYYLSEILNQVKEGKLSLCGYSFGACVAFAIALEAQQIGLKVEHLILLDGSPHYIKMPLDIIHQSYTENQVDKILEAEILLAFLQLYGAVDACSVRPLLVEAENLEERFSTAVDFLMNTPEEDSSFGQKNIQSSGKEMLACESSLSSVNQNITRMKRLKKANVFYENIKMADDWIIPDVKFKGDVYLLRVLTPPNHCSTIPYDYGLGELASGEVKIRTYQCSHEDIVAPENLSQLISDLIEILTEL